MHLTKNVQNRNTLHFVLIAYNLWKNVKLVMIADRYHYYFIKF